MRELFNVLESAFTMSTRAEIGPTDLVEAGRTAVGQERRGDAEAGTLAQSERALIERTLERTGGNKRRTAQLLGISRKKLYARIAKYAQAS